MPFAPVQAHGSISEVFPDVFQVRGTVRFAPLVSIPRNMTIVRQGAELVVLNSVRLDAEGEAALEELGKVTHVVRVGAGHGMDDAYYVDRFKATLWGPPGVKHAAGSSARDLTKDDCPLDGARVFLFRHVKEPEAVVVLEREGGVLIPCDSFQNWTSFEGCSLVGGVMTRMMGFGPAVIGGPWVKQSGTPGIRADFDQLLELPFAHLVPAHGTPLRDGAKEGLRGAIKHRFP